MASKIKITKSSGEQVAFSKKKLENSLRKAGAGEKDIQEIIFEIEKLLYPGMHTKKIYNKAFTMLRKMSRPVAARYKLKNAILQMGPSGFPFEKFVSIILKQQGYQIETGSFVQGSCIRHEIDIIAEKDKQRFMIECKFHSRSDRICNIKVPLYIRSRFLDVEKSGSTVNFNQAWIVTNTRFSADSITYGSCVGLYLLGWDFPNKNSLKNRIDLAGIYPVTCLTTLSGREKQRLLENMIVLAKDLYLNDKILRDIEISETRIKKITQEAKELCGLQN